MEATTEKVVFLFGDLMKITLKLPINFVANKTNYMDVQFNMSGYLTE